MGDTIVGDIERVGDIVKERRQASERQLVGEREKQN